MTKNLNSHLDLIRRETLSGNYESALIAIDEYISINPNNCEALLLKGNTLELIAYEKSVDSNLDFESSQQLLEAKKCYEVILSFSPENPYALFDLANLYKEAKKFEMASKLLNKTICILKNNLPEAADFLLEAEQELLELKLATNK